MGTIDTYDASRGMVRLIPQREGIYCSAMGNNHDLTTPAGRLRYARENAGLTVPDLASRAGIGKEATKKHLSGENGFDLAQAKSYQRATGAGYLWLLERRGDPPKQKLTMGTKARENHATVITDAARSLVSIREVDVNAGAGGGGEMPAAYERGENGTWLPTEAVKAEVLFPTSWIAALGLDPASTDLVRVRGDSMWPEIDDGDWVFVDRRVHKLVADDIYLIFDGFGIVVKSLAIVRGSRGEHPRVRIISANPKYPSEEVSADDVWIIGRVHYRLGRIVRGR